MRQRETKMQSSSWPNVTQGDTSWWTIYNSMYSGEIEWRQGEEGGERNPASVHEVDKFHLPGTMCSTMTNKLSDSRFHISVACLDQTSTHWCYENSVWGCPSNLYVPCEEPLSREAQTLLYSFLVNRISGYEISLQTEMGPGVNLEENEWYYLVNLRSASKEKRG